MANRVSSTRRLRSFSRPSLRVSGLALALGVLGVVDSVGAQTHTVNAGPDPAAIGRVVFACWTAPPGSSALDWVTLAAVGSPLTSYVAFSYTGGSQSGCASLNSPGTAGSYEVRYLLNNAYTLAATSAPISVVASPGSVNLTATPSTVIVGRDLYACWTAAPGVATPGDTIGLFAATAPLAPALATLGTGGTQSGCVSFEAPAAGGYQLRYLYGGTLDIAGVNVTSAPLVGSYGVSASPNPAASNRVVNACWSAPPGSPALDWLILVRVGSPNTSYVNFAYTGGAETGCRSWPAPLATGAYEVRYLINNSNTDVASSEPIDVVPPPVAITLSGTPLQVVAGRDVHACWQVTSGTASSRDVVALFDSSLPPKPVLEPRGTCGATSGCASFRVPSSGSYQVRYLSGGSLDVAAATTTTVSPTGVHGVTASLPSGPTGPIEACWTAPPGSSATDWVVLVPIERPSSQYVRFSYTGGAPSGCTSFSNSSPPYSGSYEVRYLLNNGYTDVATSNELALGNVSASLYAHEWKVEITDNPQGHPEFSVGEEVPVRTFVPRSAVDRLPADPTRGDYLATYVWMGGISPGWTFASAPSSALVVENDVAGQDGIGFTTAANGRSIDLSCAVDASLFDDDQFKSRDMPVPSLACPGPASSATIVDSSPAAGLSGELVCARYLPEPGLGLSLAAGVLAVSTAAGGRGRFGIGRAGLPGGRPPG